MKDRITWRKVGEVIFLTVGIPFAFWAYQMIDGMYLLIQSIQEIQAGKRYPELAQTFKGLAFYSTTPFTSFR